MATFNVLWVRKNFAEDVIIYFCTALKLQNQERSFIETFNYWIEADTDFFQFSQLQMVEKVEDIDEHVIANQKGDFRFLSLHTDAKILIYVK